MKALVLTGFGINCENESKYAIEKSGGKADIFHLNKLLEKPVLLENYDLLLFPGGFSFGDDLGSGRVFANKIRYHLKEELEKFIEEEKLVLGICNGFQVMVKLGILPIADFNQRVSLIGNDSGKFEDRWIILKNNQDSPCIFTKDIDYLFAPIRHGEGKFIGDINERQIVFKYVDPDGKPAGYPHNPNGSKDNIAGICDSSGRIFGMMPHPEAFNIKENCPYWIRGNVFEPMGLRIFKNAIDYCK